MNEIWATLTPPYSTICVDPPWRYRDMGPGLTGEVLGQYSTLTSNEIQALPVRDLASDNAHLYLWATTPKLWDAPSPHEIATAWGFTYKTLITWFKGDKRGTGWYYRVDTEHCLFCTRGKAPIPGELRASNGLWVPRSSHHSAKPPAFYDMVESVSSGPYIELFARAPRLGWDAWGKGYETSV